MPLLPGFVKKMHCPGSGYPFQSPSPAKTSPYCLPEVRTEPAMLNRMADSAHNVHGAFLPERLSLHGEHTPCLCEMPLLVGNEDIECEMERIYDKWIGRGMHNRTPVQMLCR